MAFQSPENQYSTPGRTNQEEEKADNLKIILFDYKNILTNRNMCDKLRIDWHEEPTGKWLSEMAFVELNQHLKAI